MGYHGKVVEAITYGDRGTFLIRAWARKYCEERWSMDTPNLSVVESKR